MRTRMLTANAAAVAPGFTSQCFLGSQVIAVAKLAVPLAALVLVETS